MCKNNSERFNQQLKRFGPDAPRISFSLEAAIAYCRSLTLSHYENFNVVSFLLPKELRHPFFVVYAYCRWSDDLADEHDGSQDSKERSLKLLDWWEQGLNDCYSKSSGFSLPDLPESRNEARNHPVFVALKEIIKRNGLPKQPFADLLAAFRRDQIQSRYETLDDLLAYCRCSADPVGRIILYLVYSTFGQKDPNGQNGPNEDQLRWSDSICTGLQLANFWQDVSRDAEMGRCYIPVEFADRFGVDLSNLVDSQKFRSMLELLVQDARQRLRAGIPLVASVPKSFRFDIALFIQGGLAVLDSIEKNGYNVLLKRPVVTRWAKIRLMLTTWLFGIS